MNGRYKVNVKEYHNNVIYSITKHFVKSIAMLEPTQFVSLSFHILVDNFLVHGMVK